MDDGRRSRDPATEPERIDLAGEFGLRLAADVVGDPDDPPVLLLHGGGQTRHSWRTTQQHLGSHGWYAVTMDLRGHGDSEWSPDADYSLDGFAADVVAVARHLGRPALIGASLGGTSALGALGATVDDPAGRALVLVDVAPNIEQKGADRILDFMREQMATGFASLDEVADAVQSYNPHRARPSDLSGLRKNVRQREDGRWYWHWDPAFITSRPVENEARVGLHRFETLEGAARSLTIPTLLVRGRQSDLLSEAGAQRFLEMVPQARYADVGGAGHMVAGDKNDVFNDAVIEFLDDVRTGRAESR